MKTFIEITEIVENALLLFERNKKPLGLYQPVEYALSSGGKRIRPALTLMACNLFSDEVEMAVNTALGLEIFHNFTLLHDDIMDRADVRRGRPTVHRKWNDNTAILSGDVMQIIAYQYIAKTPIDVLKPVLNLFSLTAAEICEGQQYDMEFEQAERVSPEEYLEMIRLKTAVLLGCALECGARIGGADETDARLLYDFGINIGLAFQLKDDLLDVYGNEVSFGKKIGGDILCNKKTYLLINALELAHGNDATELRFWLEKNDNFPREEKIEAITSIYNRTGVREICEGKMNEFYTMAIANLEKVSVDGNKKHELRKLAEKLMFRND